MQRIFLMLLSLEDLGLSLTALDLQVMESPFLNSMGGSAWLFLVGGVKANGW